MLIHFKKLADVIFLCYNTSAKGICIMIDYRKLRFNNITSPEFRHIFLLIYWPIYGATFFFLEWGLSLDYKPIESALDAKIPFCEFFIIPYLLWFGYMVWIHIYTLLFDVKQFKKLLYFIMLINTVTLIIFVLFPSKQELRPTQFERDNIFVNTVVNFYKTDTNTNVCPSLHVTNSIAVLFASWNSKGLNTTPIRIINIILTFLISISTVFLKQHSIVDVYVGVALCAVAWVIVYFLPFLRDKISNRKLK